MRIRGLSSTSLVLAATSLLVLSACSGDDDGDDTTVERDGGVTDPRDGGSGDPRDAGPRDGGPPPVRPDAGHYCAPGDEVQVDGQGVPVDPVSERPQNEFGQTNTSCIDSPISPQAMNFEYCLFECVNFMGFDPDPADIAALQVAVFPADDGNGGYLDPSYDRITGQDRSAAERLNIGYNFREVTGNFCDSGWGVEIGFTDLGPSPLFGEIAYTLRVSSSTASSAWVDTYYPYFIRRNASPTVAAAGCNLSLVERTTPDVTYDFVVGARSVVSAAAMGAGVPVPGSDDFDDGQGNGYAYLEARDCNGDDGRSITNATGGFLPPALADYYPSDAWDLARRDRVTDQAGRFLGIGFAGTVGTSSASRDIRWGVGISRDGTCTEEYGGGVLPVFPDSLSVLRVNNETILHGR